MSIGEEADVRVVKDCENGIVCRVRLVGDVGAEVVAVNRSLSHLTDSNYSPNMVYAYAYGPRHLVAFLD